MRLSRFHMIPISLFLLGFGLFQQSGEPSTYYTDSLGFALMPGANSAPTSFYQVRKFADPAKPITAQNISKNEFIGIAYGWGESSANPKGENLFSKYEIVQCGYKPDTVIHYILYKGGLGCSPVDDLWRLAYSEYPYGNPTTTASPDPQNIINPNGHGPGWAHSLFKPSDGQIMILQSYGAATFIDIIYGDNAFHLLHDMQDPTWVSHYAGS